MWEDGSSGSRGGSSDGSTGLGADLRGADAGAVRFGSRGGGAMVMGGVVVVEVWGTVIHPSVEPGVTGWG
jgi:hypothetical protein